MPENLNARLQSITPTMIETSIRQRASAEHSRALGAPRLAVILCEEAAIGAHDPDRAEAYAVILSRIQAAVEQLAGMRYVTGMT